MPSCNVMRIFDCGCVENRPGRRVVPRALTVWIMLIGEPFAVNAISPFLAMRGVSPTRGVKGTIPPGVAATRPPGVACDTRERVDLAPPAPGVAPGVSIALPRRPRVARPTVEGAGLARVRAALGAMGAAGGGIRFTDAAALLRFSAACCLSASSTSPPHCTQNSCIVIERMAEGSLRTSHLKLDWSRNDRRSARDFI